MNRRILVLSIFLVSIFGTGFAQPSKNVKTLEIGRKAPDFKLPGVDDKIYTLASFDKAKMLVIIFTCNHCPTAQRYEERIKKLTRDYKDREVAVVAISSNDPKAVVGVCRYDRSWADEGQARGEAGAGRDDRKGAGSGRPRP